MPITQAINSKANVKKYTNQDLPFAPQQPVLNRYEATSTLSQTIINLSFTVDQSLTDQFLLFVDGKLLRMGASNDYTFTSIATDNTSSTITLNSALPVDLNIIAIKLGLKKESEFGMDNRFVNVYDYLDKSFQGWVDESTNRLTAINGAPGAGQFRSSITGRASIPDITQDLRARMGIDRISTQSLFEIQNEFGPTTERVFGLPNDDRGLIRFVGNWSLFSLDNNGLKVFSGANTTDYVEITFYGTGLNVLSYPDANRQIVASVDGAAEGGNIIPASSSAILAGRNYTVNTVYPVTSGLTLDVHTVKIRTTGGPGNGALIYGFDILNESASVKTQPGSGYMKGQKYTTSAQSVVPYTTGVTGTRGGRMVVYQEGNGTISRAFQAVDASQANLTLADHTNEEVIRTYYPREFGAGRADDLSTLAASNSTRAFTLEDGTTTLLSKSSLFSTNLQNLKGAASTSLQTLTFVGTGVDVVRDDENTGTNTTGPTITVDGSSIGTLTAVGTAVPTLIKLVSGLPYGTHTITLGAGSANVYDPGWKKIIVYGPKKPTVPAGAIELADFNVMADYVANSVAGITTIGTGVLRKANTREHSYINTWNISAVDVDNYMTGFETWTTINGGYTEYTFFGTGFELRGRANTTWSATNTLALQSLSTGGSLLTLDSTNFPGLTTSSYGGFTYTYATGNLSLATSNTLGSGMSVSGLPLGLYKLRMTNGTVNVSGIDAFDIITPIHAVKTNTPHNFQNTLPTGSCGIADTRPTTALKEELPQQKGLLAVTGFISAPSTTSGVYVPIPDMFGTIKTSGGKVNVSYSMAVSCSNVATGLDFALFINGVLIVERGVNSDGQQANGATVVSLSDYIVTLPAGTHLVQLMWLTGAGTLTSNSTRRNLTVKEI